MRASTRVVRFGGLDGRVYRDEADPSFTMRGGYNFELKGEEWWVRQGHAALKDAALPTPATNNLLSSVAGIPWWWTIDYSTSGYSLLACPNYVLKMDSTGKVARAYKDKLAYVEAGVNDTAWRNNALIKFYLESGVLVAYDSTDTAYISILTTTPQLNINMPHVRVGDILIYDNANYVDSTPLVALLAYANVDNTAYSDYAYTVVGVAPTRTIGKGWRLELDRALTTPFVNSNNYWVFGIAPPIHRDTSRQAFNWMMGVGDPPNLQPPHSNNAFVRGRGGAALFYQMVNHAGTGLVRNHNYLVVTSEFYRPVAIDLDLLTQPKKDIFYDRSPESAVPAAASVQIYSGHVCATSGGRVIIGRAADPDNINKDNTIYYSAVGDLSTWYTGGHGGMATRNYITFDDSDDYIQNIASVGDVVIIFRRRSLVTLTKTGDGINPFAPSYSRHDFGLTDCHAVCNGAGASFFMTDRGPARTNGGVPELLLPQMRTFLEGVDLYNSASFALFDRRQGRVYFFGKQGSRYPTLRDEAAYAAASAAFLIANPGNTIGAIAAGLAAKNPTVSMLSGTYLNLLLGVNSNVSTAVGPLLAKKYQNALIYDVESGQTWLIDSLRISGGGTSDNDLLMSKYEGSLLRSAAAGVSKDYLDASLIEGVVDTPWQSFGTTEQKQITKLIVSIRSTFDLTDQVTNLLSDVMQFGQFQIYTDGEHLTPKFTFDLTSEYVLMPLNDDLLPGTMRFVLTPRVTGQIFRFKFVSAASLVAVGMKFGHFRVSGVEVYYDQQESNRPIAPKNG